MSIESCIKGVNSNIEIAKTNQEVQEYNDNVVKVFTKKQQYDYNGTTKTSIPFSHRPDNNMVEFSNYIPITEKAWVQYKKYYFDSKRYQYKNNNKYNSKGVKIVESGCFGPGFNKSLGGCNTRGQAQDPTGTYEATNQSINCPTAFQSKYPCIAQPVFHNILKAETDAADPIHKTEPTMDKLLKDFQPLANIICQDCRNVIKVGVAHKADVDIKQQNSCLAILKDVRGKSTTLYEEPETKTTTDDPSDASGVSSTISPTASPTVSPNLLLIAVAVVVIVVILKK